MIVDVLLNDNIYNLVGVPSMVGGWFKTEASRDGKRERERERESRSSVSRVVLL